MKIFLVIRMEDYECTV